MLKLCLFLAGDDEDGRNLYKILSAALSGSMPEGSWQLDVVDVIQMPEKALQHDVFATPTLLRELPEPIIKLIGDIARLQHAMASILRDGQAGETFLV